MDDKRLRDINERGNWGSPYEDETDENWLPEASYTGKDCDSYASWKKREILKEQFAMNERMAICTCWTTPHKGEYHAVLVVQDDNGELWVLDNAGPFCTFKRAMERGYVFHLIPEYMQQLGAAA